MDQCSVDECGRLVHAKGLCKRHYVRMHRHGNLNFERVPNGTYSAWFDAHVNYASDECLTWPFRRDADGYARVGSAGVHRIMCERAHGPPPTSKHECAHNCGRGNEGCVNPRHLRWATCKENHADKIIHGTINRGECNGAAKLTAQAVMIVRGRLSGGETHTSIANEFGVSREAISAIKRGEVWGWLK